jgi:cation transport ATPase
LVGSRGNTQLTQTVRRWQCIELIKAQSTLRTDIGDNNTMTSQPPTASSALTARKAVALGHLIVNIPVLVIILGFSLVGWVFFPTFWFIFLLVGFVLAWLWWSFAVPRWRRWALRHGAPAEELQTLAVTTGLVWSKGSVFEKTEFKIRD